MEKFADFQKDIDDTIGDNFIDFGVSRKRQVLRPDEEKEPFAMKDFLSLPHFDDPNNCFQLIAALKSNDKIAIQKVNEEDIYVYEVDATGVSIKYGDLNVHFDKFDLIKQLEEKCSMQESKKTKKTKKSKKKKGFRGQKLKSFEDFFKINRVVQSPVLKSSDGYSHEHASGDIYKIQ